MNLNLLGIWDVVELSDENANLLLAISSYESNHQTFVERKHFIITPNIFSRGEVLVYVNGLPNEQPGIVLYKGELPPTP